MARPDDRQGACHRMPSAFRCAFEHFAPPLQPHLAGQWLIDALAYPGDFAVERVEDVEGVSAVSRCEQGCKKAILVGFAHEVFAMGKCLLISPAGSQHWV